MLLSFGANQKVAYNRKLIRNLSSCMHVMCNFEVSICFFCNNLKYLQYCRKIKCFIIFSNVRYWHFLYPCFYSCKRLPLILFMFFWSFCLPHSLMMHFSAQRNIACGYQFLSTIFYICPAFTEILQGHQLQAAVVLKVQNPFSVNGRYFGIRSCPSSFVTVAMPWVFFWGITAPLL